MSSFIIHTRLIISEDYYVIWKAIKVYSVAKSCPALWDPMDWSLPGSSVHGISQARILEWITISFSRGSSQLMDQTQVSHIEGRFFTIWATREAPQKGGQRPYVTGPWRPLEELRFYSKVIQDCFSFLETQFLFSNILCAKLQCVPWYLFIEWLSLSMMY